MHQKVYVFASEEMNDVVFNATKYINRGSLSLSAARLSHFIDGDLGNAQDDAYGVDAERNMVFFYNGDANDEGNFDSDIPVLAYKLLVGPPQAANGEDSDGDGIIDNETLPASSSIAVDPFGLSLPNTSSGFLNWMNGLYENGTAFNEQFHNEGYPDGTENYPPSDFKQVISAGPFSLLPEQTFCAEQASFL